MVRGLIFQFYHTNKTLIATGVNGASCVIPAKPTWGTEQTSFLTGQRNYTQFVKLETCKVMLNGEQYPKSQSAVSQASLYA
jgi:hypothetical protein